MSPAIPAAGAVGTVGGAAARRVKTHWDRGHEGSKLIAQIGRRVKQDAEVPHEIRERLAAALPARLRLDPDVQGAVSSLLDGEDVVAAQDALAEAIARLSADVVEWPTGFGASEFGKLAAAHAASAVNEVKATDREAAHVDQLAHERSCRRYRRPFQSREPRITRSERFSAARSSRSARRPTRRPQRSIRTRGGSPRRHSSQTVLPTRLSTQTSPPRQ